MAVETPGQHLELRCPQMTGSRLQGLHLDLTVPSRATARPGQNAHLLTGPRPHDGTLGTSWPVQPSFPEAAGGSWRWRTREASRERIGVTGAAAGGARTFRAPGDACTCDLPPTRGHRRAPAPQPSATETPGIVMSPPNPRRLGRPAVSGAEREEMDMDREKRSEKREYREIYSHRGARRKRVKGEKCEHEERADRRHV